MKRYARRRRSGTRQTSYPKRVAGLRTLQLNLSASHEREQHGRGRNVAESGRLKKKERRFGGEAREEGGSF